MTTKLLPKMVYIIPAITKKEMAKHKNGKRIKTICSNFNQGYLANSSLGGYAAANVHFMVKIGSHLNSSKVELNVIILKYFGKDTTPRNIIGGKTTKITHNGNLSGE
ncbi:hypothetical protein HZA73_05135 [candidate division TA06 bacterium]|nr:hypothetical protein [candidate division TA06 bacterium]